MHLSSEVAERRLEKPRKFPERIITMVYVPFFQVLHDETSPVGSLGRGTHYSVLRAVVWHDALLQPLTKAQYLDFAVIWDEDHDLRVMKVIETIYFDGLLAPVKFIGERKGALRVLVTDKMEGAVGFSSYCESIKDALRRSGIGEWWNVRVASGAGRNEIINDTAEKVSAYLQNIDNLWSLGAKMRPEAECSAGRLDNSLLDDAAPTGDRSCMLLAPNEISSNCRRWRGDDEKGSYRHHGAIPLSESPVDIELGWRKAAGAPEVLVGCYRLDLHSLLSEGYIRRDPKPGHVRLQFVHDGDHIYIQHRPEKRLKVGTLGT